MIIVDLGKVTVSTVWEIYLRRYQATGTDIKTTQNGQERYAEQLNLSGDVRKWARSDLIYFAGRIAKT